MTPTPQEIAEALALAKTISAMHSPETGVARYGMAVNALDAINLFPKLAAAYESLLAQNNELRRDLEMVMDSLLKETWIRINDIESRASKYKQERDSFREQLADLANEVLDNDGPEPEYYNRIARKAKIALARIAELEAKIAEGGK